jgi:hypothetical protein
MKTKLTAALALATCAFHAQEADLAKNSPTRFPT